MGARHHLMLGLLVATPGLAAESANPAAARLPAVERQVCSVKGLIAQLRSGLKGGSPALRRYLLTQMEQAGVELPAAELRDAVMGERDPDVLSALAAALATKASSLEDPTLIQPLLSRAASDTDPALRAAAIRGLKAKGSVELMEANGNAVNYEKLIRDEAPEVRKAVVENLLAEDKEVYSGHHQGFAESAVRAATSASDPATKAELLSNLSTETIGPEAVKSLYQAMYSDDARVRASAAQALGGIGPAESKATQEKLRALYRTDSDAAVRKAALESIVRLGRSGAIPTLQSLRSVAPAMAGEIDAWIAALGSGLQEWPLLIREKQRLTP